MIKYNSLKELNTAFTSKRSIVTEDRFELDGSVYTYMDSTSTRLRDTYKKTPKPNVIVYKMTESRGVATNSNNAIVFLYESSIQGARPKQAKSISLDPFIKKITEDEGKDPNANRMVLGDSVEVRFTNLTTSNFIKGKVDTGATISCLHADDYSVDKSTNQVTFKCSYLSNNSLTLSLVDMQSVQSANGTEFRPVVEMDIKIGEVALSKMKFNLNNRGEMDTPVLIGQNVLEAGKFLIDPTVNESSVISWSDLNAYIIENMEFEFSPTAGTSADGPSNDTMAPPTGSPEDFEASEQEPEQHSEIDDVYQLLRGSDIKFSDLIEYANTYNAD